MSVSCNNVISAGGNYMHWKQIVKVMFWHVLQRILHLILKNYKANSPKINMFLNTNQL